MKRIIAWCLTAVVMAATLVAPQSAQAQKAAQPQVFKLGFLSSLSGSLAGLAEGQRKSFVLSVEEVNSAGGLNMPWGKVKVEPYIADDEAKLDVGVRRFREMVEKGVLAITGGIWNPMSGALNEECKINPIIVVIDNFVIN